MDGLIIAAKRCGWCKRDDEVTLGQRDCLQAHCCGTVAPVTAAARRNPTTLERLPAQHEANVARGPAYPQYVLERIADRPLNLVDELLPRNVSAQVEQRLAA